MEHQAPGRPGGRKKPHAALNRKLSKWAAGIRAPLENAQSEKLIRVCDLVSRANARANLTGTIPLEEIARKHVVDSLAAVPLLTNSKTLLDIGSGAGFPGLALNIAIPPLRTVLLESNRKKCLFISEAASLLGLAGVEVMNARAETAGKNTGCRERFDSVVCRAVSNLNVISEYALPFLKKGGIFIAYKGPGALEEISRSTEAINVLGGEVTGTREYELPVKKEKRVLVLIRKTHATPAKYPRREGIVEKRPIGISG